MRTIIKIFWGAGPVEQQWRGHLGSLHPSLESLGLASGYRTAWGTASSIAGVHWRAWLRPGPTLTVACIWEVNQGMEDSLSSLSSLSLWSSVTLPFIKINSIKLSFFKRTAGSYIWIDTDIGTESRIDTNILGICYYKDSSSIDEIDRLAIWGKEYKAHAEAEPLSFYQNLNQRSTCKEWKKNQRKTESVIKNILKAGGGQLMAKMPRPPRQRAWIPLLAGPSNCSCLLVPTLASSNWVLLPMWEIHTAASPPVCGLGSVPAVLGIWTENQHLGVCCFSLSKINKITWFYKNLGLPPTSRN